MLGKNKRDHIVYIPYLLKNARTNEYVLNMIKILKNQYLVTGDLAKSFDVLRMLRTKAVFLNWIETQINGKIKRQIILHKMFGAKIIWFFHNKYPHDTIHDKKIIYNMNWLAKNSSVIVLHSKNSKKYIPNFKHNKKKAYFIPHILYDQRIENRNLNDIRKKYRISEFDFVFTVFGNIRPYKNIEHVIQIYKKLHLKNSKLLIAGTPCDNVYAKKIRNLCKDNANIILDLRYIPDVLLNGIITISDVIVMPYKEGSSMNSGVMIKAFSESTTVICPDICMAKDMASEGFFYMYRKSLEKAMMKAYKNGKMVNNGMGIAARNYIFKHNNVDIVRERIEKMLS